MQGFGGPCSPACERGLLGAWYIAAVRVLSCHSSSIRVGGTLSVDGQGCHNCSISVHLSAPPLLLRLVGLVASTLVCATRRQGCILDLYLRGMSRGTVFLSRCLSLDHHLSSHLR